MNTTQGIAKSIADVLVYKAWIAAYVAAHSVMASCLSVCEEMQGAFPELRLVRGSIILSGSPNQVLSFELDIEGLLPGLGHFWLETVDGAIVDPTAAQFTDPDGCHGATGISAYQPFDESKAQQLPTGKCPNCGDYCYNNASVCSDECGEQYVRYLNAECGTSTRYVRAEQGL